MKYIPLHLFLLISFLSFSQSAWQPLNDFPLETGALTQFTVDGAAYVLLRNPNNSPDVRNFKYDVATDSWTEKSIAPFHDVMEMGSFSINNEAYVVINDPVTFDMQLWEYNPNTDVWIQKNGTSYANFGLYGFDPAAISLNGKGYVLTTSDQDNFRAYDPISDSWEILADYPVPTEGNQMGFSIGEIAYFVHGTILGSGNDTRDLWQYNPISNQWVQLADIPPAGLAYANTVSFTINDIAYVGMDPELNLFYRYKPSTNEWERIESCGYSGSNGFGFSIGEFGYVGTGTTVMGSHVNDVWKLNPELLSVNTHEQKEFTIYPNPASENIFTQGLNGTIQYGIYTVDGKLVSKGNTTNNSINVSQLNEGLYILKIATESGIFYKNFIRR